MGNLSSMPISDINENPLYDLLYIPLIDPKSSINNIRQELATNIGYNRTDGELLPTWLPVYQPILVVAYVSAGNGDTLLGNIQAEGLDTYFTGRTFDFNYMVASLINYGGRGTRIDKTIPFPS